PAEQYYVDKIEKLIRQGIPVYPIPNEVFVEKTDFQESQSIAREIDSQKRKENPDFQGAFHEKKHAPKVNSRTKKPLKGKTGPQGKATKFRKQQLVKLTPLNITLACLLVWAISELNFDTEMTSSWGWLIALCVILSLIDLGFRMIFKNLKKLWFAQVAFVLVVGILMVVIRVM